MFTGLIVGGGIGAAKSVLDGYRKAGDAEITQLKAENELDAVYTNYLNEVERAAKSVDDLNERKVLALENEVARFVDSFSRIKNMDYQENLHFLDHQLVAFAGPDFESLHKSATSIFDYFHKGSKLNVAGQLIKNTALISIRAQTLTNNAMANLARSKAEQAKLYTEMEKCAVIRTQAKQMNRILRKLVKLSRIPLATMEALIEEKQDWRSFSDNEKKEVAATVKYMQVIKMLIEQPIINKEGEYDKTADSVLKNKAVLAIAENN